MPQFPTRFRVISGLAATSLLVLACSQNINQQTTLTLERPQQTGFRALGGVSLDPSIELFCKGETVSGDQGYARSMARQYRGHLEKLIQLKGGPSGNGGQNGIGNGEPGASPMMTPSPSAEPTASPMMTPSPSAEPSSAPSATATSDISVVEKTTFNGKVYDREGKPVDGAIVTAKSLNSSVPYEVRTTTAGGTYAFNNAPGGVQIEITLTVPGAAPRSRVEVLKSNKTGDPNANRYDFGTEDGESANGSGEFGSPYNGVSLLPEVIAVSPARNEKIVDQTAPIVLTFSEPMLKSSVEQFIVVERVENDLRQPAFDAEDFDISWNSAGTAVTLRFKDGLQFERYQEYEVGFVPGTVIKDLEGMGRSEKYFKLTESDYENRFDFRVLNLRLAQAMPTAGPTPLPPPKKARDSYYFSYDDSASVGGVELVKHALEADRLPSPQWGKPWEFLNYEPFDHVGQVSTGTFRVSLGLWKYDDAANPYTASYEVGAHVTAPYRCKATRPALNLTLLVDVSTSMSEDAGLAGPEGGKVPSKLELVKAGLKDLSDSLRSGDIVNLMLFSNKPFVEVENYVVGSDDEKKYLSGVDKIAPLGGTNLQLAIEEAYRLAQKNYDPKKLNRVLMLTDAKPTEGLTDMDLIRQKAHANDRAGIHLSVLGFGYDHNQALLDEMTEAGRGAYYTIQTASDMKEAVRDRFIPLIDLVARDVKFKLEFPGWMRQSASAAEQVSQDASKVRPSNFSANTSQYFWEQFRANRDEYRGDQTVKVLISYTDPASGEKKLETLEKRLDEILGQDAGNLKAAHMVQLTTSLVKGSISPEAARAELDGLLKDVGM